MCAEGTELFVIERFRLSLVFPSPNEIEEKICLKIIEIISEEVGCPVEYIEDGKEERK